MSKIKQFIAGVSLASGLLTGEASAQPPLAPTKTPSVSVTPSSDEEEFTKNARELIRKTVKDYLKEKSFYAILGNSLLKAFPEEINEIANATEGDVVFLDTGVVISRLSQEHKDKISKANDKAADKALLDPQAEALVQKAVNVAIDARKRDFSGSFIFDSGSIITAASNLYTNEVVREMDGLINQNPDLKAAFSSVLKGIAKEAQKKNNKYKAIGDQTEGLINRSGNGGKGGREI